MNFENGHEFKIIVEEDSSSKARGSKWRAPLNEQEIRSTSNDSFNHNNNNGVKKARKSPPRRNQRDLFDVIREQQQHQQKKDEVQVCIKKIPEEAHHQNVYQKVNKINRGIDMSRLGIDIFEKKRVLKRTTEEFPIPRVFFEEPVWEVDELQSIKKSLNETKSKIDSCTLDTWHKHTRKLNTAGRVIPTVKEELKPEYGSQAWCKFFECLNTYPIIPDFITKPQSSPVPFYSVHLCEAPGGFISATNHFIRTHFPDLNWNWLGTTLNPHYEGNDVGSMINEDKLILTSLNNWTFLQDTTGNIMSEANLNYLIKHVEYKFQSQKVSLVTADGSIDCQTNPMEQEATVAQLHFAEIVTALQILGDGGTFVLKMFTFLECKAISHLYLLCSLFKEVHLFKPATSKEGNSEVYVVCLGYSGKLCFFKELIELKKKIGAGDESQRYSLVSKKTALASPFYDRLKDAAKFFTAHQIAVINRNLDVYNEKGSYFHTDILRDEVVNTWMSKFKAVTLTPAQQLFGRLNYRQVAHVDGRKEVGTFLDKVKRKSVGVFRKLVYIREDLPYFKNYGQLKWIGEEIHGDKNQFRPQQGKRYENVLSSRFCFGKLLLERQELRDAVKQLGPVFKKSSSRTHLDCSNHEIILKDLCQSFYPIEKASQNGYWTLHILCFREAAEDLLFTKDINQTGIELKRLMSKFGDLKKGDSLFLCQFPMLTRLHVGLIYMLSTVFEKAIVYLGVKKEPSPTRGVILHNFLGFVEKEDTNWTLQMAQTLVELQKNDTNSVVLQVVPTEVLVDMGNYNGIFEYNLFNTASNIEDMITETKKAVWVRRTKLDFLPEKERSQVEMNDFFECKYC